MSTQPPASPTTIEVDDYTIETNAESVEDAIKALTPTDPKDTARPREVKRGAITEDKPGEKKTPLSEAATELGKKGGKAAAKARAAAEKDKPAEQDKPAAKATPEEEEESDGEERPATATADGGEETDDDEAAENLKPKTRERIETLARERAQLRREKARLERELEATRRTAPRAEDERRPEPRAADADIPAKPKIDDFENLDEYLDARDKYNRAEWERETEAMGRAQAHVQRTVKRFDTYMERVAGVKRDDPSFRDKYDAFMGGLSDDLANLEPTDSVLRRGGRPGAANVIADYLIDSERAADMATHLSENPDQFQRIATLQAPPHVIVRELAKIEARLEDATAGTPSSDEQPASKPAFSQARPPARPVAVAPRVSGGEPGEDSSFDDHADYYNARDREKRRRRSA